MPRILIADSHELVSCGLHAALRSHGLDNIVGHARDEQEMMELVSEFNPDVVILDFLAEGFSVESILKLKSSNTPGILALTEGQSGSILVTALRAGVDGYVKKDCDLLEIVDAVKEVASGILTCC